MTETYEQLRDSATGEAGAAWKGADREESSLRALHRELKEDPRYTNEHKAEQAWQRYEVTKERIVEGKAKARKLLEKRARSGERFSIPMPEGESPITGDTQKLLASQNEASRIVRKLDRLDKNAKGPFKPYRGELLKTEYKRSLDAGGVQEGAICRGVLSVCDELGIDKHGVVDGFRKERHHESLESAQYSERLIGLIGVASRSRRLPSPAQLGAGGPSRENARTPSSYPEASRRFRAHARGDDRRGGSAEALARTHSPGMARIRVCHWGLSR
jgi:hypothetical protein